MWVTATGAFLVAVAAALFVAVRWDSIGAPAKLGILAALTGATLLAGERMHEGLPATGRVLSHLGAFLAPLNVAAVTVHVLRGAEGGGSAHPVGLIATLATAVTGSALWWALDRRRRSPLLGSAAAAGVVVAAGSGAALAGTSGPLLLAGAALVATLVGGRRTALAWATTAGTAPALGAAASVLGLDRAATLAGLGTADSGPVALAAGLLGAAVIGREAARAGRPEWLVPAAVSATVGVLGGRAGVDVGTLGELVGWASVLLAVELAALAWREDPFWGRPLRVLAAGAEGLAVLGFALAAAVAAVDTTGFAGEPAGPLGPVGLAVTALVTAAWLVGDLRRAAAATTDGRAGWWAAPTLVATTVGVGVALGTHAALPTTVVLLGAAAWAVLADHPTGAPAAVVAATVAVALPDDVVVAASAGAAGGLLLAWASRRRGREAGPCAARSAWAWAAASVLPPVTALTAGSTTPPVVLLLAVVVALGLTAEVLDTAPVTPGHPRRGVLARTAAALVAAGSALAAVDGLVGPGAAAAVATAAAAVAVVGALRTDDPRLLALLASSGPAAVATAALAAGYEPAPAGVAVALAVVVATGMRLLLAPRWADALVPAVGGGVLAALALATGDPLALGVTVAVVGGVLTAEALVARSLELGVPGVGICVLGTWQVLAATDVEALDAWAAPVAAALLAGGAVVRHRDRTGSWLAYAPPVALLGGAALAERVADGPGVHALVVGAVGVAAVALGGARRLVGPLVSGTVLLVALTVHESLTLTAAVPTWAWLALGGTTLIGVGVGLERRETGPFEAGQRLARVVRERYS